MPGIDMYQRHLTVADEEERELIRASRSFLRYTGEAGKSDDKKQKKKTENGNNSDKGGNDKGGNNKKKPFVDDAKVPLGSWIQHVSNEDGYMFWRNNATGECTRDLWFSPAGSEINPQNRHLVPASFAPIVVQPAPPKKSDKKEGGGDSKGGKDKDSDKGSGGGKENSGRGGSGSNGSNGSNGGEKNKGGQKKKLVRTWFCQPWEEIFHPVTGEKCWVHRQTGDTTFTDPLL